MAETVKSWASLASWYRGLVIVDEYELMTTVGPTTSGFIVGDDQNAESLIELNLRGPGSFALPPALRLLFIECCLAAGEEWQGLIPRNGHFAITRARRIVIGHRGITECLCPLVLRHVNLSRRGNGANISLVSIPALLTTNAFCLYLGWHHFCFC